MGALDDAIREHLELKRKHGATEEEVAEKQHEAQRTGALPVEPGETLAPAGTPTPEPSAADEKAGEPVTAAAQPDVEIEKPEPSPLPPVDEAEPDEVLPEEALEMGLPTSESSAYDEPGAVAPSSAELIPEDPESNGTGNDESVLEETPDFLEDMPEQDRLWFEQKPPKDFDFDD